MNAKSSEHAAVNLLIPWYANGTLSGSDLLTVSRHLKVCAECRMELAQMQQLNVRWQEESTESEVAGDFARLMASIEDAEQDDKREMPAAEPERIGKKPSLPPWRKHWNILRDWCATPAGIHGGGLALASVAGALIVVATVTKNPQWADPHSFHTLAARGSMAALSERDLRVVFAPDVRSEQITDLIGSLNARIVDGPSEIGAFTVRLEGSGTAANNASEVASRLRGNPLILMAEPALPPAPGTSAVR